jgi:hypothetical protein
MILKEERREMINRKKKDFIKMIEISQKKDLVTLQDEINNS